MMSKKIILGTVQFGMDYGINNLSGRPTEKKIEEILNYSFDNEIRTLDTADMYGNAPEIIGKYNQSNTRKFRVNTKFIANELSLIDQIKYSSSRLRVENIDVYFIHNFRDFFNHPGMMAHLVELKERRYFNKLGLSVYDNDEFLHACESDSIDVIQLPFNLLDNYGQRGELIKLAKQNGKEIQVRSVFLQGLFFKSLSKMPNMLKPLIPYLERIHEIARAENITIENLALNYAIQQDDIDNVIIGVDSIKQLKLDLENINVPLSAETIGYVNQIFVKESELLYPKNWN